MAGNKEGAIKAREKLYAKYGGEEGFKEHMKSIASEGGKKSSGGGFAYLKKHDPERFKEISAKGGKLGKRK